MCREAWEEDPEAEFGERWAVVDERWRLEVGGGGGVGLQLVEELAGR